MATEVITNAQRFGKTAIPPLRVLALDGGGMRGYYTASVLNELCERSAKENRDGARFDLARAFHLCVGASTGAIIAAALATGKSPQDVMNFYEVWGPQIFANPLPDFDSMSPLMRNLKFLLFMGRHARTPLNVDAPLRSGLEQVFTKETFGSLYRRRNIALLMPAIDMSTHKAWVFKTSHIQGKHRDDNTPLVDACLAATAAPFFLPLAFYGRPFVDGGLVANNPILMGALEALEMTPNEPQRPIEIVSVGTCPPPAGDHATEETRSWGFEQWQVIRRFSEVVLDAQVSLHVYTMRFLLKHLDRPITIFRLHQSEPNEDEVRLLGMDRADPEALHVLRRRSASDGQHVHSEIGNNGSLAPLREIFSNLATIEDK